MKYGKLYNWYAVNDPRGLAPQGWHVPSDSEWIILEDALGSSLVAGGKMKEPGWITWVGPNIGGNNNSGFTALGGGYRIYNGPFAGNTFRCEWWAATENNTNLAWLRLLSYDTGAINLGYGPKLMGLYVRCIRD